MVNYLTVQDILWTHLQLCKRVDPFDYARLEDAVYLQYGYGRSVNLDTQAAQFLYGFAEKAPFGSGDDAVAFVGALAFLRLNGRELVLSDKDGVKWANECFESATQAGHSIRTRVQPAHDHHESSVKAAIEAVIEHYPKTIAKLLAGSAVSAS
jgi:prophage maintenance system killer protein